MNEIEVSEYLKAWQRGWDQAMKIARISFTTGMEDGDTAKWNSFGDPIDKEWYELGCKFYKQSKT